MRRYIVVTSCMSVLRVLADQGIFLISRHGLQFALLLHILLQQWFLNGVRIHLGVRQGAPRVHGFFQSNY